MKVGENVGVPVAVTKLERPGLDTHRNPAFLPDGKRIAAFVARGLSAELLEYCVREHELVTSDPILEEVRRYLVAKVKVTAAQAKQTVELLRTRPDVVAPVALQAPVCRDADDDIVLGTAAAGACDLIVTGDSDLLVLESYQNIPIVSPRGFWSLESHRRSRG